VHRHLVRRRRLEVHLPWHTVGLSIGAAARGDRGSQMTDAIAYVAAAGPLAALIACAQTTSG
jgi:hypothetical protein